MQRFLDAAQAIITEKGSTDFTVQEVVDRSRQSLRSLYQHFDGKHELRLALFEDALRRATVQIAAAASGQADPAAALKTAVQLLFELSRPDRAARRPLFTDFASPLLLTHPAEVRRAQAPLLDLLTDLTAAAAAAGKLRDGTQPRQHRGAHHGNGHVRRPVERRAQRGSGHPPGHGGRDLGLLRLRDHRKLRCPRVTWRHGRAAGL